MNEPWYRSIFIRPGKSNLKTITAKAEQGDSEAQFGLGLMFSSIGEAQDYAAAAQWYLKAAQLDHPLAQFNLAQMYAKGQGVERNDQEALVWMRKAADQGDAGAQFELGSRNHRFSVRPSDPDAAEFRIEAYKWFYLAAAQGYNRAAAASERVTLGMTHEEVAEGEHRIGLFESTTEL